MAFNRTGTNADPQSMTKRLALTHYTEQARIATLEQQRDELAAALRASLDIIKGWHNMGGAEDVWEIYLENAPEMQPIRAALAKLK